jgi:hypothetical protein
VRDFVEHSSGDDAAASAGPGATDDQLAFVDGYLQGYDDAVQEVSACLRSTRKVPASCGNPRGSTLTRGVRLLVRVLRGGA